VSEWILTSHYAATYNTYQQGSCTISSKSEIKESYDRSGKYYTSIIYFQALEGSGQMRTIKVAGDLGVGTILPVCYDPICPRYRSTGEWPDLSIPSAGVVTIAVVSSIGLTILLVAWLTP
jgi:hypothetical protein